MNIKPNFKLSKKLWDHCVVLKYKQAISGKEQLSTVFIKGGADRGWISKVKPIYKKTKKKNANCHSKNNQALPHNKVLLKRKSHDSKHKC